MKLTGPLFTSQLLALFMAALAAGQPATQPTTRPAIGMNSDGVSDSGPSVMFIDQVKSARPFGSPTSPQAYDLPDSPTYDADGWPQGDFGLYVGTNRPIWPGVHKVRCGGKVDQIKLISSAGTVGNYAYDPAVNVTTADVTVPENSNQLVVRFLGTQRNPNDAAEGKGVRWVQILCPGYEAPATPETGVFTREFIRAWQPFGHARFLGMARINRHAIGTWGQRAKPTEAQWSSRRGVPWEVMADLCARAKVAPWVCLPHLADDDYVGNVAKVFKAGLPPGMPVIVQRTNEFWNWDFDQAQYEHAEAQNEVNAGDASRYNVPIAYWDPKDGKDKVQPPGNKDVWRFLRHARLARHQTQIFRDVFGPEEAYRIRAVLDGASALDWQQAVTLGWINQEWGPPSQFFEFSAIAPYYASDNKPLLTNPAATPQQIAQWMRDAGDAAWNNPDGKPARHKKLTDHWKMKLAGYEGGGDLDQNNINLPNKVAAMALPLTGEGNALYYAGAFTEAGMAMHTGWLCGRYSKDGFYAETNDVRNLSTPRYTTAAAAAGRFTLADPVKPDPHEAIIAKLQADLLVSQADAAAAKATAEERAQRITAAKAALGN